MSIYGRNTNNRFSGYYSDLLELVGQKPVGIDGEWVIVTTLNKKYYWDISSSAWTDGGSIDSTVSGQDDIITAINNISGLGAATDLFGTGLVSVGTTRVEVSLTGTTKSIVIQYPAISTNTGTLYIGKSNVTNAGANAFCSLLPGMSARINYNDATNAIYVISNTASQKFIAGALI